MSKYLRLDETDCDSLVQNQNSEMLYFLTFVNSNAFGGIFKLSAEFHRKMLASFQENISENTIGDVHAFNTAFAGLCYATSCVQCTSSQDVKHQFVKQAVAIAKLLKSKSEALFRPEMQTAVEVAISSAFSTNGCDNYYLEYLLQ